ncbi:hypothetical protein L0222_16965 [bacterium]|nr:hypothetical protein [bacterium]MCI0606512.1 hypothetical protein [bacterium]
MKKFGLFLVLIFLCSSTQAVDIKECVFVEIANRYKEAFNGIDFKKVQTLWSPELMEKLEGETEDEKKVEFERKVSLVMEHLGKMTKVELAELDPPDGAFFTAHFERGTAELFFVLNEKHQATEISLRVTGHSSCSEEDPPEPEDQSDE